MKRSIEVWLIVIAMITFSIAAYSSYHQTEIENKLKVLAFAAGFIFFVYKLLTGWLFINLNLKIDAIREVGKAEQDHLALKLTLSKGKIDSL